LRAHLRFSGSGRGRANLAGLVAEARCCACLKCPCASCARPLVHGSTCAASLARVRLSMRSSSVGAGGHGQGRCAHCGGAPPSAAEGESLCHGRAPPLAPELAHRFPVDLAGLAALSILLLGRSSGQQQVWLPCASSSWEEAWAGDQGSAGVPQ